MRVRVYRLGKPLVYTAFEVVRGWRILYEMGKERPVQRNNIVLSQEKL